MNAQENRNLFRLAICYITGIVHTDGNVQNADASSMSMSWPIDGDVYIPKVTVNNVVTISSLVSNIGMSTATINSTNWEILGG